jgi:pimeloyl-ACP methyl ester carboxylesterase
MTTVGKARPTVVEGNFCVHRWLLLLCAFFLFSSVEAAEYRFHSIPSFDGLPLNVVETGNPDGEPVILLHGFSQSYLSWTTQLNDPKWLARYRLIALDLRGHGGSGKPWEPDSYSGHEPWAKDLRRIIEFFNLHQSWLIGWSFGGYIAFDYVREYGQSGVSGIVLTGSNGGLLPRSFQGTRVFTGDLEKAIAEAEQFMTLMSVSGLPDSVRRNGVVSNLLVPAYARNAMSGKRLDNTDLLTQLRLPVLVILGDKDLSLPTAPIQQGFKVNSAISVRIYAGVGHSAFIEDAERFSNDVAGFITPIPEAVEKYLAAVNRHNAAEAVEQFADNGEMHLTQSRVVRGHVELLEIERFHEIAQPILAPEGLRAHRENGLVRVSMERNVERSRVFEAMGLPSVTTQSLHEAFRVHDGRILLARQPEFTAACQAVMSDAIRAASAWLENRRDVRRDKLLPSGRVTMDVHTVADWITVLREWRTSSGWSPPPGQVRECST